MQPENGQDASKKRLTGAQIRQLHDALCSAFPDVSALRLMVRTAMEENQAKIAGGVDLSEIVLNLIDWAEAHGRLAELVEKAYQQNPGNPELRDFAVHVLGLPRVSVKKPAALRTNPQTSWADWTGAVINKVKKFAQGSFQQDYFQHLTFRHRTFDVKGLSTTGNFALELERVFVDLSIVSPPREPSTDPLRDISSVSSLPKERRSVWTYLQTDGIRHIAVIGAPGSGKTTLLKHMALTLAAGKAQCEKEGAPASKIPILLFLRDHANKIAPKDAHGQFLRESDYTLEQAVTDTLMRFKGPEPPDGWFIRALEEGHCLVLLDGLDEVADLAARKMVGEWVEKQLGAFGNNLFVIASRPFGYKSNPLSGVSVLEILSFSRTQQEQFVRNWYLANEIMAYQKEDEGVRMEAREGADNLLQRIRSNNALSDLAVNPLLLTMIATVHRYRSSLPGRRVELYAEICEVFLGKRRAATGLTEDLTPLQKQRVLQSLAYEMMCRETREIPAAEAATVIAETLQEISIHAQPDDFLKAIEDGSGLLIEREKGVYSFSHLTFQEFLAAVQIQEQKLEVELEAQVQNAWWHEVIRLYCARAVEVTSIIYRCLSPETKTVFTVALAVECIADRGQDSKLGVQVDHMLNAQIEHGLQEIRHDGARTLLTIRKRQLVRLDEDRFVDNSLISHGEYQYFLDVQREKGKYYQPDHWKGTQFPPGEGRNPVVGVRPSDAKAFCDWLTESEGGDWIEDGAWRYRLPQIGELQGEPLSEQAAMGKPLGYWTLQEERNKCISVKLKAPTLTADMLTGQLREDLDRAHDRDLAFALAHDLAHDFPLGLDHAFALARALAVDLALDLSLARAIDVARDLGLDLALARALARDRALALTRALARDFALDLALTIALTRYLTRYLAPDLAHDRVSLRVVCYYQASLMYSASNRLEKSGRKYREEAGKWKKMADSYMDLYVEWVTLQKRIDGELPAWEGIRIIKERVLPTSL